jgi:lipopolysaccharide transport system ATP-binding protein
MDEIIDFAEIQEFIDMPVQSYSSGMTVRLGFAVATALDPDVLILGKVYSYRVEKKYCLTPSQFFND